MSSLNKSLRNIYIHIPFCIKKCLYCDFPIHALGTSSSLEHRQSLTDRYLTYLFKEITLEMTKYEHRLDKPLKSLYVGGGTPSLLHPKQLESLIRHVEKYVPIDDNTEVSLELDPGTFDK